MKHIKNRNLFSILITILGLALILCFFYRKKDTSNKEQNVTCQPNVSTSPDEELEKILNESGEEIKTILKKNKEDFSGFVFPKNAEDLKTAIANHILPNENNEIKGQKVTNIIDLGNGCTFNVFFANGVPLTQGRGDGYMDAGNRYAAGGKELAGAFNDAVGEENMRKGLENKNIDYKYPDGQDGYGYGNKEVLDFGSCVSIEKIKTDNVLINDKDLFYAVGVKDANTDRLKALEENLFFITIDYLLNEYSKENGTHLTMEQISKILGDNFDGFKKQVNCNYQVIKEASSFAQKREKTESDPYYLLMCPISTGKWRFDVGAAVYINLAIMYYLSSIAAEKIANMHISMWCFKEKESNIYNEKISKLLR